MTPEEHKREHRRLRELTHRNLMRLIDSELNLALSMANLAQTQATLGDDSHARTLLKKAKQAIDAVCRRLPDTDKSSVEGQEIETRVQELTRHLDTAQGMLGAPAGAK